MKANQDHGNFPNFGSLSAIIERYKSVPFEQFQKELNDWFYSSLAKDGVDAALQQSFPQLPDLVSKIYHQAEVAQLLSDSQISANHGDK